MDYDRIYRDFISDRRQRESGVERPFDRHHILPRTLGGSDDPENIIRLSPPDHIFAHMLLAKIHGGVMVRAVYGMLHGKRYAGRRSRREYTWLRARLGEMASSAVRAANARRGHGANKGKPMSEEQKAKVSATKRAQLANPEYRAAVTAARLSTYADNGFKARGRPKSQEHKAKIGAASRATWADRDHPMKGKRRDPKIGAKISATRSSRTYAPNPMKGKKMPPEHGAKISATRIAKFAAIRQQRAVSTISSLCGQ